MGKLIELIKHEGSVLDERILSSPDDCDELQELTPEEEAYYDSCCEEYWERRLSRLAEEQEY